MKSGRDEQIEQTRGVSGEDWSREPAASKAVLGFERGMDSAAMMSGLEFVTNDTNAPRMAIQLLIRPVDAEHRCPTPAMASPSISPTRATITIRLFLSDYAALTRPTPNPTYGWWRVATEGSLAACRSPQRSHWPPPRLPVAHPARPRRPVCRCLGQCAPRPRASGRS